MKTTLLLPDELLEKTRQFASKREMSMTEVMKTALAEYLQNHQKLTNKPLRLKPFAGDGYANPDKANDWAHIRSLIYPE